MNLFLFAMYDEAFDVIKNAKLIQDRPFKLYMDNNNYFAITKVGKVNAAFVLTILLNEYQFNNIFNIGFVGAIGNFKVGEVYQIDNAKYHDVDATAFSYELGQVPGMPASFNAKLLNNLFPKANLLTGDTFLTKVIPGNYLIDMEGTALLQVAYLNNVEISLIKVVSDVIGSSNHIKEYQEFEKQGSLTILEIYNKIIKMLG